MFPLGLGTIAFFLRLHYMASALIAMESVICFEPLCATAASESKFRCQAESITLSVVKFL